MTLALNDADSGALTSGPPSRRSPRPPLTNLDLHADGTHDCVQSVERRIGCAALDVRDVRLIDARDRCDLFLGQLPRHARLCDLSTDTKVRAQCFEVGHRLGTFSARFGLDLAHEVAEFRGHQSAPILN